ncbi:Fis family transcriptional regulator [Hydrogenimonas sp. SS33]|uniref:Fis family transcriptional regulator n=1 Tax=Hydrogenimonas leucolamina TaxID=2954236 RepID=UPI00336C2A2B
MKVADAARDVAAKTFIAASKPLKEALKSANLLKTLKFNTLISGEPGTGRHTLANLMMPNVPVIDGRDEELYSSLEKNPQLIVEHFESIELLPKFRQAVEKHGTQVVAIAEKGYEGAMRSFFSVHIELPPLKERPEDVPPLAEKFRRETLAQFGEEAEAPFVVDLKRLDLSKNAFSLRRSVVLQYLAWRIGEEELLTINESYIKRRMEEEEDLYRRLLYLYEVPLIRAGTKRYKSQVKMAQLFGLNRNTLRKKINEWKDYLS